MFGLSSGLTSSWFIAVMSAHVNSSWGAEIPVYTYCRRRALHLVKLQRYPTGQVAGRSSVVLASSLVVVLKNWKPTVLFPGCQTVLFFDPRHHPKTKDLWI